MPVSKRTAAAEQLAAQPAAPSVKEPYWKSECGRAVVYVGDCREVMAAMEPEQFHAVVTDPPYGLEFMGLDFDAPWKHQMGQQGSTDARAPHAGEMDDPVKAKYLGHGVTYGGVGKGKSRGGFNSNQAEDSTGRGSWAFGGTPSSEQRVVYGLSDPQGFQAWFLTCAEAILRVAKPGAHLLSFGGTRMWHRMACAVEDAGFDIRDTIMWVYGSGFPKSHDVSKGIDKMYGAERDVKGIRTDGKATNSGSGCYQMNDGKDTSMQREYNETNPATDAARQWSGWGTALKPSHEPLIFSQKPQSPEQEQRIIIENLFILEAQLWSLLPASAAQRNFRLSETEHSAVCASAQWNAEVRSSTLAALSDLTGTSQLEMAISSCLNTVMSWRNILGANSALTSTFITKTKSSTTIDWKTLRLCSSVLTPLTTIQAAMSHVGSWWNASNAAKVLNASAACIESTHALSALVGAIEKGHISRQAEGGLNLTPAVEPIIFARRPVVGTVAQNTLEHGTGGINIDGCRVGSNPMPVTASDGAWGDIPSWNGLKADNRIQLGTKVGRWPANLIMSHHAECVLIGSRASKDMSVKTVSTGEVVSENAAMGGPNYGPTIVGSTQRPDEEVWQCHPDCPTQSPAWPTQAGGGTNGDLTFATGIGGEGKVLGGKERSGALVQTYADGGSAARFFKTFGWGEDEVCRLTKHANDVEHTFDVKSESVVSALRHAVERSTETLVLSHKSVRAQSTSVSETQLGLVCESVTETIQSLERRSRLELLPERSTVRLGPVTCVATPSLTGTTSITISLTTLSHCVELVTFSITPKSAELGGQDLAKSRMYYTSKADKSDRPHGKGATAHPTVKPQDLMSWLVRLVCAKGGTVLDPFMGSGSTGCAAIVEGMRFVGIEQSVEYADIAVGRLKLALAGKGVKETPPPPRRIER